MTIPTGTSSWQWRIFQTRNKRVKRVCCLKLYYKEYKELTKKIRQKWSRTVLVKTASHYVLLLALSEWNRVRMLEYFDVRAVTPEWRGCLRLFMFLCETKSCSNKLTGKSDQISGQIRAWFLLTPSWLPRCDDDACGPRLKEQWPWAESR